MLVKLDDHITSKKYFKWKEALLLPSWKIHHSPSQQEVNNIIETCTKLDKFREYINKPFIISCWIRPVSTNDESGKYQGKNYNEVVKGAKASAHINRTSCRL
jgi:hypothetical protein